jgi:hypothetical protein
MEEMLARLTVLRTLVRGESYPKALLRTSRHELTVGSEFNSAHGTRLYFDANGQSVTQAQVDAMKRR